MNENLNLCEVLKDVPKGLKLWSPAFGDMTFIGVDKEYTFPVITEYNKKGVNFLKNGKIAEEGEVMLFPSKDQCDWSKFELPKPKAGRFDYNTLRPFDKIVVRCASSFTWCADLFSHIGKNDYGEVRYYGLANSPWLHCIPYNDDTKHLVGTTDEAPEYYRYWEDNV